MIAQETGLTAIDNQWRHTQCGAPASDAGVRIISPVPVPVPILYHTQWRKVKIYLRKIPHRIRLKMALPRNEMKIQTQIDQEIETQSQSKGEKTGIL